MKRRIVSLCLAFLLLLPMVLTGCSSKENGKTLAYTGEYDPNLRYYGAVAENDNFQLLWDDNFQLAVILDKATGEYFGTTPYEYYQEQGDNVYADYELYNPLTVHYVKTNEETNVSNIDYVTAKDDAIEYGTYTSELIENGVRITYYFTDVEIAVSLDLVLTDKGLQARIPMDRIQENKNRVFEISVLPYMASAKLDATDSYLMVPTGGGALIDAKSLNANQHYSEAIYGADKAEPVTMLKQVTDQSYLPIFGAKNSAANIPGILGVVSKGASCAYVNANTGDGEIGYAGAYASFRVRGQEEILYNNSQSQQQNVATIYSEDIADYDYLAVDYLPLTQDASYMGMANTYRNLLMEQGYLQNKPEQVPALSVNFLGATQTPESFFGIPYKADTATTTIKETQKISEDLKKLVGEDQLLVTLLGYGKGGLSNTTVGGDFSLSGKVGSKKDLSGYLSYAEKNNVLVAMNYELAQFQDSGAGFNPTSDAGYNISKLKSSFRGYVLNTSVEDEEGDLWYLLSRGKLGKALDKALKANKKLGFNAISLGSLNTVAYSDYRKGAYVARAHMDEDVEAYLKKCAENGYQTVASQANLYAALNADYVTEVPMSSSKYAVLTREVPMYALVFQGYKNLTSSSINLSTNVQNAYLKAVATGMTLQFTLCDSLHESVKFEESTAYISSRYSDWKGDIEAMVTATADLHKQVGNQAIVSYTEADGLSTTVFENGVTVYVNYTDEAVSSPAGEVPAQSFIYN